MSNICTNRLRFIGRRQALTDLLAFLSQGGDVIFVESPNGSGRFGAELLTKFKRPTSATPGSLTRHDTILASLLIEAPLRYRGFAENGWNAPSLMERQGFDTQLKNVEVPEELLEQAESSDEQLAVLHLVSDSKNSPPLGVLRELSRRLPWLLVECEFEESGNGVYGARAWRAGKEVASVDVEPDVTRESLGIDDDDDSDDADTRVYEAQIDEFREQVREKVTTRCYEEALTALRVYPSWDALTQAAHRKGPQGLHEVLAEVPRVEQALRESLDTARQAGRCSWLDLVVYENDAAESLFDEAFEAPGVESDQDVRHFPFGLNAERVRALLASCSPTAADSRLASALTSVLADPDVRLFSGEHPIGILCESAASATESERAGLGRIVDALVDRLPQLPEAQHVGVEFLVHERADGNAALLNLIAGAVAEHDLSAVLPKSIQDLVHGRGPHGPALNLGYRFDARSDRLLRSLLHATLQGTPEGLRIGAAAGFDDGFVFRSLCLESPMKALHALIAARGSVLSWPEDYRADLEAACTHHHDSTALRHLEALAAQERMKQVIVTDGESRAQQQAQKRPRPRKAM